MKTSDTDVREAIKKMRAIRDIVDMREDMEKAIDILLDFAEHHLTPMTEKDYLHNKGYEGWKIIKPQEDELERMWKLTSPHKS